MHWVSPVHVVKHEALVVLQMYGLHIDVVAAGHAPLPSQFADGVKVLPEHTAVRQPVAVDHGRHAPAPLHVPSFAQFPALGTVAVQRPFGSVPPDGTGEQVPTLPATLQLWQRPVVGSEHAVLQQTPSVQKPVAH